MENNLQTTVYFIDKFIVPSTSIDEFIQKLKSNRSFIEKLSGYIRGEAFQKVDNEGNLIIITIAVWEDHEKLNLAKQAVQAEFKRTGFNPVEFYQRLNIQMEREQYINLSE